MLDPNLDVDIEIKGMDKSTLNVMGATESGGLISIWVQDALGEAAVELSPVQVERVYKILKRTHELYKKNEHRKMYGKPMLR